MGFFYFTRYLTSEILIHIIKKRFNAMEKLQLLINECPNELYELVEKI